MELSDLNKESTAFTFSTIINALIALTGILIAVLIVIKRMLKPIEEIETVAKDISNGMFDTSLLYQSNDELGRLSDSMRALQFTTKVVLDDISRDNWFETEYGVERVLGELSRCGNQFVDDVKGYLK